MKKNPGRKERRKLAHQNRLVAGRIRAKRNEWLQKHPQFARKGAQA